MAAVVMMRRRRRMMLLYYNGTAVVWSAFVHHRLGFMMGAISMNSGAVMDGTAFMA